MSVRTSRATPELVCIHHLNHRMHKYDCGSAAGVKALLDVLKDRMEARMGVGCDHKEISCLPSPENKGADLADVPILLTAQATKLGERDDKPVTLEIRKDTIAEVREGGLYGSIHDLDTVYRLYRVGENDFTIEYMSDRIFTYESERRDSVLATLLHLCGLPSIFIDPGNPQLRIGGRAGTNEHHIEEQYLKLLQAIPQSSERLGNVLEEVGLNLPDVVTVNSRAPAKTLLQVIRRQLETIWGGDAGNAVRVIVHALRILYKLLTIKANLDELSRGPELVSDLFELWKSPEIEVSLLAASCLGRLVRVDEELGWTSTGSVSRNVAALLTDDNLRELASWVLSQEVAESPLRMTSVYNLVIIAAQGSEGNRAVPPQLCSFLHSIAVGMVRSIRRPCHGEAAGATSCLRYFLLNCTDPEAIRRVKDAAVRGGVLLQYLLQAVQKVDFERSTEMMQLLSAANPTCLDVLRRAFPDPVWSVLCHGKPVPASPNIAIGKKRLFWREFFHTVVNDTRAPALIWGGAQRKELVAILSEELQLLESVTREHRFDDTIMWNAEDFRVYYDSLDKEVLVGGYYLIVLARSEVTVAEPVAFLGELFLRLVKNPSVVSRRAVVKMMCEIYKNHEVKPYPTVKHCGPYDHVDYITNMLRETDDRCLRDQLLIFTELLVSVSDNIVSFLLSGGVNSVLSVLTHATFGSETTAKDSPLSSPTAVSLVCMNILQRIVTSRAVIDNFGAILTPLPRAKRLMSQAASFGRVVSVLGSEDNMLVAKAMDLLSRILEHNPNAVPTLYNHGFFEVVVRWMNTHHVGSIARLIKETHLKQGIHPGKSMYALTLPKSLLTILDKQGPEEFADAYQKFRETPSCIWTDSMQQLFVSTYDEHIKASVAKLSVDPFEPLTYTPVPPIKYPELENKLIAGGYFIESLVNAEDVTTVEIEDPAEVLRDLAALLPKATNWQHMSLILNTIIIMYENFYVNDQAFTQFPSDTLEAALAILKLKKNEETGDYEMPEDEDHVIAIAAAVEAVGHVLQASEQNIACVSALDPSGRIATLLRIAEDADMLEGILDIIHLLLQTEEGAACLQKTPKLATILLEAASEEELAVRSLEVLVAFANHSTLHDILVNGGAPLRLLLLLLKNDTGSSLAASALSTLAANPSAKAITTALIGTNLFRLLTSVSPAEFTKEFFCDHETPVLIWSGETRQQLQNYLVAAVVSFAEEEEMEICIKYLAHERELSLRGVFLRVYNRYPSFKLDNPILFITELISMVDEVEGDDRNIVLRSLLLAAKNTPDAEKVFTEDKVPKFVDLVATETHAVATLSLMHQLVNASGFVATISTVDNFHCLVHALASANDEVVSHALVVLLNLVSQSPVVVGAIRAHGGVLFLLHAMLTRGPESQKNAAVITCHLIDDISGGPATEKELRRIIPTVLVKRLRDTHGFFPPTLDNETRNATLVWTPKCRLELTEFLTGQIEEYTAKIATDPSAPWYTDKSPAYTDIAAEICLAGVFLRLYAEDPAIEIDAPEKVARESVDYLGANEESEHRVSVLRGLSCLARTYPKAVAPALGNCAGPLVAGLTSSVAEERTSAAEAIAVLCHEQSFLSEGTSEELLRRGAAALKEGISGATLMEILFPCARVLRRAAMIALDCELVDELVKAAVGDPDGAARRTLEELSLKSAGGVDVKKAMVAGGLVEGDATPESAPVSDPAEVGVLEQQHVQEEDSGPVKIKREASQEDDEEEEGTGLDFEANKAAADAEQAEKDAEAQRLAEQQELAAKEDPAKSPTLLTSDRQTSNWDVVAAENAEIAKQEEAERVAAEKAEAERVEAEKIEAERIAAEKAEDEKIAAEQKAEEDRIAAEKQAEEDRVAAEKKAEEDRIAAEKAEADRIAAEKAEDERIAAEKAEAERIAAEKAEAERIAAEKAEAERVAAEKAEAERIAAEKAEAERVAAEKAEAERIAAEKAEEDRIAAEKKAEEERIAAEKKAEEERIAAEEAATEEKDDE